MTTKLRSGPNHKSDMDEPKVTAEKLRAGPPPKNVQAPGGGIPNRSGLTTHRGYLSPSFGMGGFLPLFFWVSFLHHNQSHSSVEPSLPLSDRYQGGEFGADEINSLPDWIQASLRLMHSQREGVFPSDVTIQPLDGDDRLFEDQISSLLKEKKDLESSAEELNAVINAFEGVPKIEAEIKLAQSQLDETSLAKQKVQDQLNETNQLLEETMKTKENLRETSPVLCFFDWTCELWVISSEIKTEKELKSKHQNFLNLKTELVSKHTRLKANIVAHQQELTRAQDLLRKEGAETQDIHILKKAALEQLNARIHELQLKIEKPQGFVLWSSAAGIQDIPNLKTCPANQIFIFKASQGTRPERNPLFNESVDESIRPRPETADLVVCVDESKRVKSVHIVQDKKEVYSSKIERNDNSRISSIAISNSDNLELERHSWTSMKEGIIRYIIRFVHNKIAVELYSDINPDKIEIETESTSN